MVLVIIGIIVYTFRDSAGPILEQLEKTTPAVIAGICAMTVVYHCVEGVITTLLAKQYNREFTLGMGITNAFLCSFYRVATLGSGAGVAAIVYLGEHGIEYSKSFGMYMLQYAFHKISIAFFSMILFALNWNYMRVHFGEYMWLLLAGYLVTLIITVVLILFSCSRQSKIQLQFMLLIPFLLSRLHLENGREIISQQRGEIEISSCQSPGLMTKIRTQKEIPRNHERAEIRRLVEKTPFVQKTGKSELLDAASV